MADDPKSRHYWPRDKPSKTRVTQDQRERETGFPWEMEADRGLPEGDRFSNRYNAQPMPEQSHIAPSKRSQSPVVRFCKGGKVLSSRKF